MESTIIETIHKTRNCRTVSGRVVYLPDRDLMRQYMVETIVDGDCMRHSHCGDVTRATQEMRRSVSTYCEIHGGAVDLPTAVEVLREVLDHFRAADFLPDELLATALMVAYGGAS